MKRSWVVTLSIAVIAATPMMSAASGEVRIVQTGCDTLGGSPPLVRVQFSVENLTTSPIATINMSRVQPAELLPGSCSPPILQCEAPPGWMCYTAPDGDAIWGLGFESPLIAPGETRGPFAVISDDLQFCPRDYFMNFSGSFEPFYAGMFRFNCDNPVPARPATWGTLKQLYR